MAIRDRLKKGFTLVELMIVVAIVGVLAVLAVYGVRKYIANAKTAEAKNSLGQIGKDAVTAFEGEHMDDKTMKVNTSTSILRQTCGTAANAVPTNVSSVQGKKYQSQKIDWSPAADVAATGGGSKGFPCLKYEMTAPQYYSYNYASTTPAGSGNEGEEITGTANGDLNGDGVNFSTFIMNGKIQEGRLTIAPAIGETSPEE